jgi:FlaA1/EpsC-like NDP-sugar epimerase
MLGVVAFWASAYLRFGKIPAMPAHYVIAGSVLVMAITIAIAFSCGLYRSVTRYPTPGLTLRAAWVALLSGTAIALVALVGGASPMRVLGLGVVYALLLFTLLVLSRHLIRWMLGARMGAPGAALAVYGAGEAGRQLVTALRASGNYRPALFIDDDRSLVGRTVEGLLVLSARGKDFEAQLRARDVREILLAIPSLTPTRRREILELLAELPNRVRSVPRLSELVSSGFVTIGDLRDLSIEDLLGRDPVAPLPGLLERCICGKTVLVTGGGGSIGGEICRQVLGLGPARLVVLDHSELALYEIERILATASGRAGAAQLRFRLGSVNDAGFLAAVFAEERIDTVYHAAAYKHVPIVEANPLEGLRNNLLGTWQVARAAAKAGVGHFVLISTDKAVRPTNVMGATKRMAELVVQVMAEDASRTVFTMVRFGNVLGSSGSVVPLFRKQIEHGGPVTLTHREITRYFMTIQEAVQLVIQAGAMARGGEVFVLDMGAPVRVGDLAIRMVHLSGRTVRDAANPAGEIAIEVTGLRPGEKLHEELLISGEATGTAHPRIWQVRDGSVNGPAFLAELRSLEAAMRADPVSIDPRRVLKTWVEGYAGEAVAPVGVTVLGRTPHQAGDAAGAAKEG